jgi:restriction system protein
LFFERLVVELLVKMGYGGSIKDAGKAIGKTGDEEIDGTIKEDKLGLDIIYIQAKRWQSTNLVGRPELHKFVGALAGQGAKKGIFITTSSGKISLV